MQTETIAIVILIAGVVVAAIYSRRRRKGRATPEGGNGTGSGGRHPRDHTDQR